MTAERPPAEPLAPVSVGAGPVTLDRDVAVEGGGEFVTVTHTLSTEGADPKLIAVVDPVVADCPVEEIVFHADFEPRSGSAGHDAVTFEGVVTPDDDLVVRYGIWPSEPVPVQDLEAAQTANPPRVEEIQDLDGEHESEAGGDGSGAHPETESRAADGSVDGPADLPPDPVERTAAFLDGVIDTLGDGASAEMGPAPSVASDPGSDDLAGEGDHGDDEDDGTSGEVEPDDGAADSIDRDRDVSCLFDRPDPDAVPSLSSPGPADGADGGSTADDESVTAALLSELREGTAPPDRRRALARELAGLLPDDAGVGGSVDARLRRLESRVGEFDAYVDAFRDRLEEPDSAPTGLDAVGNDVAALREDLDATREAVETATAERARTRDRLESLAADVEALDRRLDDRLGAVEDRLDDLREEGADVNEVERSVADLETEIDRLVDGFRDLREDVDELRDDGGETTEYPAGVADTRG